MSYNKHDKIVDLASAAFIDVMGYLEKNGVPKPDDVDAVSYTHLTLPTSDLV